MKTSTQSEARFYFDQQMEAAVCCPVAHGVAAVYSHRCPGKAAANEDAAAIIPFNGEAAVLIVADGLGGSRSGEHAAAFAVWALQAAIEEAVNDGSMLRTAILNGIEKANRAVCEELGGAATTLAVVEVQGHTVRPYHVGDSMILVTGQRGKIKLQTVCHSPVGFALEAGVLDEHEAMHHEDRHLVSNVIGSTDMRIEVGSMLTLAPRDTLLIASDGLADNLRTSEIVERLRKGSLEDVCAQLAADAHQRMTAKKNGHPSKPDDLTFIAFRPSARD